MSVWRVKWNVALHRWFTMSWDLWCVRSLGFSSLCSCHWSDCSSACAAAAITAEERCTRDKGKMQTVREDCLPRSSSPPPSSSRKYSAELFLCSYQLPTSVLTTHSHIYLASFFSALSTFPPTLSKLSTQYSYPTTHPPIQRTTYLAIRPALYIATHLLAYPRYNLK